MWIIVVSGLAIAGRFEPPPADGGLVPSRDVVDAVQRFSSEIETALAAGDVASVVGRIEARGVEDWFARVVPNADAPIELELFAAYPFADGAMVTGELFVGKLKQESGVARYKWGKPVYVGPGPDGVWRLAPEAPEPYPATVDAVAAEVWIDPNAEWLEAWVELTVDPGNSRVLEFDFRAAKSALQRGGLRILELSQGSRPCRWTVVGGRLIVELVQPHDTVTLFVRYAGEPPQTTSDYVRPDGVVLRQDAGWIPLIEGSSASFDVTVHGPAGWTFLGQGRTAPTQRGASRWIHERDDGFTVYGGNAYEVRSRKIGPTEIEVAAGPEVADRADWLAEETERALVALTTKLGPYPHEVLRVSTSDYGDGHSGYGAVSNVTLGWRSVEDGDVAAFLAHELAHGWFGGAVGLAPESVDHGQWNESLAEYASAWGLEPAAARAARAEWSKVYADLPAEDERPMLDVATRSAAWKVHRAVTYCKGALVLTALEDRLGRDEMTAIIGRFVESNTGRLATWADFVAVVRERAGDDHADFLQGWLEDPSAPELQLVLDGAELVIIDAEREHGGYTGAVEVGFWRADGGEIGRTAVALTGPRTVVEVPPDAARAVLDPEYRLPRRIASGGAGVEVILSAPE